MREENGIRIEESQRLRTIADRFETMALFEKSTTKYVISLEGSAPYSKGVEGSRRQTHERKFPQSDARFRQTGH
jgi:hypothetical protein